MDTRKRYIERTKLNEVLKSEKECIPGPSSPGEDVNNRRSGNKFLAADTGVLSPSGGLGSAVLNYDDLASIPVKKRKLKILQAMRLAAPLLDGEAKAQATVDAAALEIRRKELSVKSPCVSLHEKTLVQEEEKVDQEKEEQGCKGPSTKRRSSTRRVGRPRKYNEEIALVTPVEEDEVPRKTPQRQSARISAKVEKDDVRMNGVENGDTGEGVEGKSCRSSSLAEVQDIVETLGGFGVERSLDEVQEAKSVKIMEAKRAEEACSEKFRGKEDASEQEMVEIVDTEEDMIQNTESVHLQEGMDCPETGPGVGRRSLGHPESEGVAERTRPAEIEEGDKDMEGEEKQNPYFVAEAQAAVKLSAEGDVSTEVCNQQAPGETEEKLEGLSAGFLEEEEGMLPDENGDEIAPKMAGLDLQRESTLGTKSLVENLEGKLKTNEMMELEDGLLEEENYDCELQSAEEARQSENNEEEVSANHGRRSGFDLRSTLPGREGSRGRAVSYAQLDPSAVPYADAAPLRRAISSPVYGRGRGTFIPAAYGIPRGSGFRGGFRAGFRGRFSGRSGGYARFSAFPSPAFERTVAAGFREDLYRETFSSSGHYRAAGHFSGARQLSLPLRYNSDSWQHQSAEFVEPRAHEYSASFRYGSERGRLRSRSRSPPDHEYGGRYGNDDARNLRGRLPVEFSRGGFGERVERFESLPVRRFEPRREPRFEVEGSWVGAVGRGRGGGGFEGFPVRPGSNRATPNVIHGSILTDRRDMELLRLVKGGDDKPNQSRSKPAEKKEAEQKAE